MEPSPFHCSQVTTGHNSVYHISAVGEFLRINWVPFLLSINLENDWQGHFEIDGESGDIRTTEMFNLYAQPYYTLKIGARDGGSPPLEEEAIIYVQVQSYTHMRAHTHSHTHS